MKPGEMQTGGVSAGTDSDGPRDPSLVLDRQDHLEDAAEAVRGLLPRLMEAVGRAGWSVSVLLTDAPGIQIYNRRFKDRNHPTDVLAFPATAGEGAEDEELDHPYLGDIVVSVEQAVEQAPEYGNSALEEVLVLVIHGVLHLTGMDHETDEGQMEERERELRIRLLGEEREEDPRTAGDTGAPP